MMNRNLKVYILELLMIVILFFALFAPNIMTRSVLAVIMFLYMLLVCFCLKRRKINSIYKKQVILLMLIFALVYLGVFYVMGFHFGYTKAKVVFSVWSLFRFIIPISVVIIASEVIRRVFLSQNIVLKFKSKRINLSLALTYIASVLVDLVIYTGVYNLSNLDDFLVALGFVLFASLSCNLLYNYIAVRYGSKGNIIFRLLTVLYIYIIPIIPDVYIFFRSFLRMLYPYIIYVILERIYSKNDFTVAYNEKRQAFVGNTILVVVMTLLIMLISCQFKYGILVIGSRSMTGTLNMGDAIIYESYENQVIREGQVIVFDYNGTSTIHRVVDVQNINGEIRYYTKGDANSRMDDGYATIDEVQGLVKLRVKYIGYPTLWVRDLFSR